MFDHIHRFADAVHSSRVFAVFVMLSILMSCLTIIWERPSSIRPWNGSYSGFVNNTTPLWETPLAFGLTTTANAIMFILIAIDIAAKSKTKTLKGWTANRWNLIYIILSILLFIDFVVNSILWHAPIPTTMVRAVRPTLIVCLPLPSGATASADKLF